MKFAQKTIGFTLIELLVVITIIGILATGGVVTYTSQIQKARDTTRITDMKGLQSGLEQFYQDRTVYPTVAVTDFNTGGVMVYVPKIPKDPKTGQPCNSGTACDYMYSSSTDLNGILLGEYKISTGLENSGNVTAKAATDAGVEANRLELGLNFTNVKSTVCARTAATATLPTTTIVTTAQCNAGLATALMIAGNP
jgi:prepilin-type N-terminal cleavage/methylation domain-containing protein